MSGNASTSRSRRLIKLLIRVIGYGTLSLGAVIIALGGLTAYHLAFSQDSFSNRSLDFGPYGPDTPSVTDPSGGMKWPDPVHPPTDPKQAAMIARGKHLAMVADCESCHTVPGQAPFSGGRGWPMPVGYVYSPNITPSKRFGIGNWTDKQFYAVFHQGISPGRSLLVFPRFLYPLMPYTDYAKLPYSDVMDIKAYLDSLKPVDKPDRHADVWFPANIRAGILAWQILFFHPHPVHYGKNWNAQQKRGAFLVEALGHCNLCHTPRNLFFAREVGNAYAGGRVLAQPWYAPSISSSKRYGIGAWSREEVVKYLHDGGDLVHGAPFGAMKEVVSDSLSQLPRQDIEDIAAYLQTATKPQGTFHNGVIVPRDQRIAATLFRTNCARCHGENGEGVEGSFPNLAHNEAISEGLPDNIIAMMLGGDKPWHQGGSAMPNFRYTLSAGEISMIANYVRTHFGNHGAPDSTVNRVRILRMLTRIELQVDAGNTAANITYGSSGATTITSFQEVSGSAQWSPERQACMVDLAYTVPSLTPPGYIPGTPAGADLRSAAYLDGKTYKYMRFSGACSHDGSMVTGILTMHGETHPFNMELTDVMAGNRLSGFRLTADIEPSRWGIIGTKGPWMLTSVTALDNQPPHASST